MYTFPNISASSLLIYPKYMFKSDWLIWAFSVFYSPTFSPQVNNVLIVHIFPHISTNMGETEQIVPQILMFVRLFTEALCQRTVYQRKQIFTNNDNYRMHKLKPEVHRHQHKCSLFFMWFSIESKKKSTDWKYTLLHRLLSLTNMWRPVFNRIVVVIVVLGKFLQLSRASWEGKMYSEKNLNQGTCSQSKIGTLSFSFQHFETQSAGKLFHNHVSCYWISF